MVCDARLSSDCALRRGRGRRGACFCTRAAGFLLVLFRGGRGASGVLRASGGLSSAFLCQFSMGFLGVLWRSVVCAGFGLQACVRVGSGLQAFGLVLDAWMFARSMPVDTGFELLLEVLDKEMTDYDSCPNQKLLALASVPSVPCALGVHIFEPACRTNGAPTSSLPLEAGALPVKHSPLSFKDMTDCQPCQKPKWLAFHTAPVVPSVVGVHTFASMRKGFLPLAAQTLTSLHASVASSQSATHRPVSVFKLFHLDTPVHQLRCSRPWLRQLSEAPHKYSSLRVFLMACSCTLRLDALRTQAASSQAALLMHLAPQAFFGSTSLATFRMFFTRCASVPLLARQTHGPAGMQSTLPQLSYEQTDMETQTFSAPEVSGMSRRL